MALEIQNLDMHSLLDGATLCRTSTSYSCVSDKAFNRKSLFRTSTCTPKPLRKSLHHHKDPQNYAELPIFENPCPLCVFKHWSKVLKLWLRQ